MSTDTNEQETQRRQSVCGLHHQQMLAAYSQQDKQLLDLTLRDIERQVWAHGYVAFELLTPLRLSSTVTVYSVQRHSTKSLTSQLYLHDAIDGAWRCIRLAYLQPQYVRPVCLAILDTLSKQNPV